MNSCLLGHPRSRCSCSYLPAEQRQRGLDVTPRSWRTWSEVARHDTAAGRSPHMLLKMPTICPGPPSGARYTGPPESPFWLWTPCDMVNHPLLTLSTVPQVSPVMTPKWQTACPGCTATDGFDSRRRPPGRMLLAATLLSSTIAS